MTTTPRIRVLIVDDSSVVRRVMSEALGKEALIEVVGTAATGTIALSKIEALSPDVVILDVEMPEVDGIETLRRLRAMRARLPVIMFSTHTTFGATATLDALGVGANDYVTKPSGLSAGSESFEVVLRDLVRRIKALSGIGQDVTTWHVPTRELPRPRPRAISGLGFDVVAIGASTGGPTALDTLISGFLAPLPVPVVIVQHMPPMFTKILAERLDRRTSMTVVEAAPDMEVKPGWIYIAPGDFHMEVVRRGTGVFIATHQAAQENSVRPAYDVLLRSVEKVFGGATLAVILTGMGQDGLKGCQLLDAAGAEIIAQDRESSVVWGMPGFVAQAGLADAVLPIDKIAAEVVNRVQRGRTAEGRRPVSTGEGRS
jgi:two-component system chemotaxis response regulator CheB